VIERAGETIQAQGAPSEVSPWLEMTQWGDYLRGYSFGQVAPLAALPDPSDEPLLVELTSSIHRVIHQAYQSIRENKINVFDQVRINSFLQRQRAWDRPLFVRLKKATYRSYEHLWQRLVCFAYRSTQTDQPITLRHQLTPSQIRYLDEMVGYGTEVLAQQGTLRRPPEAPVRGSTVAESRALLDRVCLRFSIALLDHTLKGDLFESVLVGFLAVLGVDAGRSPLLRSYGPGARAGMTAATSVKSWSGRPGCICTRNGTSPTIGMPPLRCPGPIFPVEASNGITGWMRIQWTSKGAIPHGPPARSTPVV
jgi:hypothetical protein